jgi:stearoyl-CoA desaturase (delta-9 desaturase)
MDLFDILIAVVVGLVVAQAATYVTTVYLHRGITHSALTLHPVASFFSRIVIWVTSGIRPREWAGVHRRHHAAVDTPDDPHSPAVLGVWRVFFLNAWLYRKAKKDTVRVARYTRDLKRDWWDRVVFDRETIGPLVGIGALCAVFGWFVGLLAALVHAVAYIGMNGAVNAFGHVRGERPNDNSATNERVLALATAGEGLHNNHHAAATAARLSWQRGEVDPGWWFIRALSAVGLCRVRHPGGLVPVIEDDDAPLAA